MKILKDYPVTNAFVNAALLRNVDEIRARLVAGEDPNQRDLVVFDDGHINPNTHGKTALYFALWNHDMPLLKLLDEFGADFSNDVYESSLTRSLDRTPSFYKTARIAAVSGFIEALKYIQDTKVLSGNRQDEWGLLSYAVSGQHERSLETVRYLVEECGINNFEPPEGERDLIQESEGNPEHEDISFTIASYLLGYAQDVLGKPIDLNRSRWREAKMQLNVHSEANEDFKKFSGLSFVSIQKFLKTYSNHALTHAAVSANLKRVALYLEYGADPFLRDHNGMSALDAATDKRNPWYTQQRYKPIEDLIRTAQRARVSNVSMFIAPKPALPE